MDPITFPTCIYIMALDLVLTLIEEPVAKVLQITRTKKNCQSRDKNNHRIPAGL